MIKIFFVSAIFLLGNSIFSQNIEYHTSGNGYNYEIVVANKAFDCIVAQCFSGLIRTNFINHEFDFDSTQMNIYLDSLNILKFEGSKLSRKYFRFDGSIPSLNFYRTFYFKESDEVLFQIILTLEYDRGLLIAKEISIRDENLILTPPDQIEYRYKSKSGSKTNIPFPPVRPEVEVEYMYLGINLCPDCKEKKLITIDNDRNYWLKETYKFQLIRNLGEGYLLAKKDSLYGIITVDNHVIVPFEYDEIVIRSGLYISQFFIKAKKGKLFKIFNFKGETVIPLEYDDIQIRLIFNNSNSKVEGLFILKKNNYFGLKNSENKTIIPFEYNGITMYHSKYLKVFKNGFYGVISLNGEILFDLKYKEIELGKPFKNHIYQINAIDKNNKRQELSIRNKDDKIEVVNLKLE